MKKNNQTIKSAVIILSLLMIGVGGWGVLSSYNTSSLWRTIGSFQYPQIEYTADKLYFSYGAFVTILAASVFVLYSVLLKTGELRSDRR